MYTNKLRKLKEQRKRSIVTSVLVITVIFGITGYSTGVQENSYSTPFTTTSVQDESKFSDQKIVTQAGRNGLEVSTYRIRKLFGIQLSHKLIATKVISKPKARLQTVGAIEKTTTAESIELPYDSTQEDDPDEIRGFTSVSQSGSNGIREDFYEIHTLKGQQISKTLTFQKVVQAPVPQITKIGINYVVGSMCEDGWISESTGRGTCSHHIRVAYTLYAYCGIHFKCN